MTAPLHGHRVSGWLCAECGVVAKGAGLVPSIELEQQGADVVPILRLQGEDGHGQVVTLGFENLAILMWQAMACQVADPDRGPKILADLSPEARANVLEEMRDRLWASRRRPPG